MVYHCYLGCSHYTWNESTMTITYIHTCTCTHTHVRVNMWVCKTATSLELRAKHFENFYSISFCLSSGNSETCICLQISLSASSPQHPHHNSESFLLSLGKLCRCCWVSPGSFVFLSVCGSSSQAVSCILISQVVWDLTRVKSQMKGSFTLQCHRPANLITSLKL